MSLNWKEIDLLISEWNFNHGKIQQIIQPTPHSLFIEIYARETQYLSVSLENTMVRIHTSSTQKKKPHTPQRFQQLLQSRLIGMAIIDVSHINQDRIVKFTLLKKVNSSKNENNQPRSQQILFLYFRLWSNQANILLTNPENLIIDLAFRRPKQFLMPGNIFTIPPRTTNKTEKNTFIRPEFIAHQGISFNKFIEQCYNSKTIQENIDNTTNKFQKALNKQLKWYNNKKQSIITTLTTYSQQLQTENYGNLLLSNLQLIKLEDTSLRVTIQNTENFVEEIIIPLNKSLSPIENAEHYFNQIKKAKKNYSLLQNQETKLNQTMEALQEIQSMIQENNNNFSSQQIKLLFPDNSHIEKTTHIKSNHSDVKIFFQDGPYIVMVGRNVKENDMLLRKLVKGNDIWLHVRGYSGSYVFIRAPRNKTISLDMLKQGGQIAALYSKAKHETYVDIYYTEVKYLKRIKNAIGLVVPIRNKNLQIKVDTKEIKKYLHTHTKQ